MQTTRKKMSIVIAKGLLVVDNRERENNNIYQISIYTSSFLNSQTRLFFPSLSSQLELKRNLFFSLNDDYLCHS